MLCFVALQNGSLYSNYAHIIRHQTGKTERSVAEKLESAVQVELPEASQVSGRLPDVLLQPGSLLSLR